MGDGEVGQDLYYNRRLRGTVAYRFRNYFAIAVLGGATICGLVFHFLPGSQLFKQKLDEGALNDNEETLTRKHLFRQQLRTSSETLRLIIEDDDNKPVP